MTARPAGRLVVAVTGASGAPYAVRVLQLLHARREYEVHLVISHAGATKYEAGFIGSSASVGMLIGALGIGFVADRVGRKLAFMLGMAIYSVLSLVLCLTWNYESLLVLRMVQGIGLGAGRVPPSSSSAGSLTSSRSGRAGPPCTPIPVSCTPRTPVASEPRGRRAASAWPEP